MFDGPKIFGWRGFGGGFGGDLVKRGDFYARGRSRCLGGDFLARCRGGRIHVGVFDVARCVGQRNPTIYGAVAVDQRVGASGTAAFIPAFKLSSVANVAVIWAAAPFLAAALAWIFLRERPATRVVLASAATFGGVLILAWGSLRSGSVIGDLLALWMTLMMSSVFVVYRRWPETPAGFPTVMASLFLLPFAYAFTDVASMPANEIWILVAFGAVFSMASVLMFEGARRIPSAEVALIGTLETPLAFVLAFLILGEVPLNATLIGGAIIFVSVVWAQGRAFKE